MNQSKTDIFDDDVIVPVSEAAKDISRKESDDKIQYLSNIERDINSSLTTITNDLRKIESLYVERQNILSELDRGKYQLTLAKLKLEQKNQQILRDEIKKRRVHEEYLKLNNEEHFYAREKPSSVAQQKKENRVRMGEKLAEKRAIQEQIDKDKQTLPLLESDTRVKEQNVDRLTKEAKARAEAEAEAKAKLAALMATAGVNPTPTYTPEMIKSAQASLVAAGGMVLNRVPGMLQLTASAEGVLTTASELAGSIASALWRGAAELSRIATVSTVGSTVGALVIGFWPKEVGLGSDQIHGRDMELFAAQALLFAAGKVNITPEMTSVNLPVRGMLVTENGRQHVSLVKTGVAGVSTNVPVLRAVRDEKTGLDRLTLPAVAGAPSRTILINPVPVGPTAPANTGNSLPVPVTPVHTGTTIKQADSIVTTTFPAEDLKGLQDFIYWQPDATGSGVEAIYVMLSGPYGDTNAKGKYSGRDYHTEKAGGPIQNLDWKTAKVDRAGVDKVKLHTGRFGESPDNKVMIDRLEKILKGELQVTDTDKRFYTHELRELERYRGLGIKDGEVPKNQAEVWNNTHTATLEDYKLSSDESLLYTPEALNSLE